MKKIFMMAITMSCLHAGKAQNVGIGTVNPNSSAVLDITATNKGLLVPRVALTGITDNSTIPDAVQSLLIYNTAAAGAGRDAVTPGFYYRDAAALAWVPIATADNGIKSAWLTGGNNGLSMANNYIGTNDNASLQFKINSAYAGLLSINGNAYWGLASGNNNGSGANNVAIGSAALAKNTDVSHLVAIGDSALYNNAVTSNVFPTANFNTAVGSKALYANTLGYMNTAVGFEALASNTENFDNTAVGGYAMHANTLGYNNTATGTSALGDNTTGTENTANGFAALTRNIKGNDNAATGSRAMFENTTGNNNTANGFYSLYSNKSGNSNVAIGMRALQANVTGSNSVAIGDSALYSFNGPNNLFQGTNTAIGSKALFSATTGSMNTAIGSESLYAATEGFGNVAIGVKTLHDNTTGAGNIAIGISTMGQNKSGTSNVAIGNAALYGNNSTGNFNVAIGSNTLLGNVSGYSNVAMGTDAMRINVKGHNSVALGDSALYSNIDGYNTATGSKALLNNTYGYGNVANGAEALVTNVSGAYNTAVGMRADVGVDGLFNATAVGAHTQVACSNCLVLGSVKNINSAADNVFVGIGTTAPQASLHIKQSSELYPVDGGGLRLERASNSHHWDIGTDLGDDLDFSFNGVAKVYFNNSTGIVVLPSDLRLKKDIKEIGTVLPGIMQLVPKTYHYKDNSSDAMLSYGFIAQEVEKIFPEFVITKGADKMKAIAYQNFNVIAIKAIQEQQAVIETLDKKIAALQVAVDDLIKRITSLEKK